MAVASYFKPRSSVIVPNVSWGFGIHECDILCVTKSGYLYEIEIKISRSDLRADSKKRHGHISDKIRNLWFAIPKNLEYAESFVPPRAGILIIQKTPSGRLVCHEARKPVTSRSAPKVSAEQAYAVARLGALRVWSLKEKILKIRQNQKDQPNGQ